MISNFFNQYNHYSNNVHQQSKETTINNNLNHEEVTTEPNNKQQSSSSTPEQVVTTINNNNNENNTLNIPKKPLKSSIDFSQADLYFKPYSNWQLLKSYTMLTSCRFPVIRKYGPEIFEKGGAVVRELAKYTYFPYFCGGEELKDTEKVIKKLKKYNLKTILDYSVEGPVVLSESNEVTQLDETTEDAIAKVTLDSIYFMGEQNRIDNSFNCPFGVVKVTGIANCSLLERLSKILCFIQMHPETDHAKKLLQDNNIYHFGKENENLLDLMKEYTIKNYPRTNAFSFVKNGGEMDLPKPLTEIEIGKLERVMKRLEKLCIACKETGLSLLVDAEQTYYQPAIDHLYMMLSLKYNTKEMLVSRTMPIVYNTYQMYLKDALYRLQYDYHFLSNYSLSHGVKLVRGAYMKSETARCTENNLPYPFQQTLLETHVNYVKGVEFCFDKLYSNQNVGMIICSHNQDTLGMASRLMVEKYGFDKQDPRVIFAQLYGMGDNLSLALSFHGYNVGKYVPFGKVIDVMPYLSRRLIENGDMISGSSSETKKMMSELQRRISIKTKQLYNSAKEMTMKK
ncbi:hypothetical protein ABK040_015423 [Willaertia magna]